LPARDVLIHAPRGIDNTKLRAEMDKELRRSGMVLDKPEVLNAMEHGVLDGPRFLPIALDKEGSITKGVATAEELGKLGRYVDKLLERIAREMRSGNIDADPCGRGENDNVCMYCEFASACHFADLDPEEHLEVIRSVKPEDFWRYVDETIGEEADA
ncbi:MAG: PD-(D/E)XK nuclease family protein, partial [Clostridia bacterium]|nr:PD-(D/E)XK nuclease family protein [Clostridia bacterium]